MHIAVEGCSHGELDTIYNSIQRLEEVHGFKVDLLLCCGDFQSVRNEEDLKCMACPIKYMEIHDFYQYHSGEKKAPVLTIFIGGNHEASNYLQELPYGGWVAPNIYYMGYAGVVRYGGLRIGGLSGIYKGPDYLKGHFEKSPYSGDSIRSVYHVRNLEVFRLKQLSGESDIFMSHDWPRGIYHHGNKEQLLRCKKHFRSEVEANTLGSRAAEELMKKLCPKYWFSGHLHVKFPAIFRHKDENCQNPKTTKFLALDKCLPRRDFLQVLEIPSTQALDLKYDAEWLTILHLTNHLLSVSNRPVYMPGPGGSERYQFTPTQEEIEETLQTFGGDLKIPLNFVQTARSYSQSQGKPKMDYVQMPNPTLNPQTELLCNKLDLDDPMSMLIGSKKGSKPSVSPTRLCLNNSEMNITLNTSMLSTTNVDEIDEAEVSDHDDDDDGDIIMELKLTPKNDKSTSSLDDSVIELKRTPKHNVSSEDIGGMSPIKRDASLDIDVKRKPSSSSPREPVARTERRGLRLSDPKLETSSSSLTFTADSSASSSMSESELSPRRSPQTKRLNESEQGHDSSVSSSPLNSEGSKNMKKFKRRNESIYSSTEEEVL